MSFPQDFEDPIPEGVSVVYHPIIRRHGIALFNFAGRIIDFQSGVRAMTANMKGSRSFLLLLTGMEQSFQLMAEDLAETNGFEQDKINECITDVLRALQLQQTTPANSGIILNS